MDYLSVLSINVLNALTYPLVTAFCSIKVKKSVLFK